MRWVRELYLERDLVIATPSDRDRLLLGGDVVRRHHTADPAPLRMDGRMGPGSAARHGRGAGGRPGLRNREVRDPTWRLGRDRERSCLQVSNRQRDRNLATGNPHLPQREAALHQAVDIARRNIHCIARRVVPLGRKGDAIPLDLEQWVEADGVVVAWRGDRDGVEAGNAQGHLATRIGHALVEHEGRSLTLLPRDLGAAVAVRVEHARLREIERFAHVGGERDANSPPLAVLLGDQGLVADRGWFRRTPNSD